MQVLGVQLDFVAEYAANVHLDAAVQHHIGRSIVNHEVEDVAVLDVSVFHVDIQFGTDLEPAAADVEAILPRIEYADGLHADV